MTGTALLLAGLGVVALAFAMLTAILYVLQPFANASWIVGNLLVGVILLAAAGFMSLDTLRERMRSGSTRRAGRYGTSAILSAVLAIVILGIGAFLSVRHSHRFDVSESGVHTLSEQTKQLLAGLDAEHALTLTAFFGESEAPPIRDLLDRYVFENPEHVDLVFVEPNDAPGLVEELGLGTEELSRGVVRLALASGEAMNVTEFDESAVTNALQKLIKSKDKKVYFLEGHNERSIEPGPNDQAEPPMPGHPAPPKSDFALGPDTYGRAAEALVNETYHVESLLLATAPDVPADAAAVVIAGPTRPFFDGELAALARYAARGGALFVAIDPRAQTNLYGLLDRFGVRVGDDVVVDRALAIFGQATTPIAQEYDPAHAITSVLREPTLFPMVRSVEPVADAAGDFSILVRTSENSWAERDLEAWRTSGRAELGESDLVGPVPIAVAGTPRDARDAREKGEGGQASAPATESSGDAKPPAEDEAAKPGRLVVFGDSDFATNQYLTDLRNRDLFVNSVNWLAGEAESITIRPNTARSSSFEMSQDEFRFLQVVSLLIVPEAIAVVGVLVWWSRRTGRA